MNTDPIADYLTRLRNGIMAGHESVVIPASSMKVRLSAILKQEGYIHGFKTVEHEGRNYLIVNVKYVKTVYIYQTIYYYTMKYFNNATDAAAFASLAGTSALPSDPNQNGFSSGINTQYDNNYRSHFGHAGLDMWEATRIWIAHSLRYTRQYDDPSAP